MLLVFARAVIGATFFASAAVKSLRPRPFVDALPGMGVPSPYAGALAVLIITTEWIVTVTMVAGGPLLVPGFGLAAAMLIIFSVALFRVIASGVDAKCYCFGSGANAISSIDLVRNAGLVGLVLIGAETMGPNISIGWLPGVLLEKGSQIESFIAAVAGFGFAMIWSQLPDIFKLLGAGSGQFRSHEGN